MKHPQAGPEWIECKNESARQRALISWLVLFILHNSGGLVPLILEKWQSWHIYCLLHVSCFCVKLKTKQWTLLWVGNSHLCAITATAATESHQGFEKLKASEQQIQQFSGLVSHTALLPRFPPSLKPKDHHEIPFPTQVWAVILRSMVLHKILERQSKHGINHSLTRIRKVWTFLTDHFQL